MDGATFLLRRLRLISGLVLLTYVVGHLGNTALGLISLDVLEAGRVVFLDIWRGAVGTVALYGALLTHFFLALWSLYRRPSLRFNGREAVQYGLGLITPPLLALHALGTRGAEELFDNQDTYHFVLANLWSADPWEGIRQTLVVIAAWSHACIGLHIWLRRHHWYRRWQPTLLAIVLTIPLLALAGFSQAAREVDRLRQQPGWDALMVAQGVTITPEQVQEIYNDERFFLWGYVGVIAMVLAARLIRRQLTKHKTVTVRYQNGSRVVIDRGMSILDASRKGGIPHAAVCGGHGRCSTCRVHINVGQEFVPPPSPGEAELLQRLKLPRDVRLACQLRPSHDIDVTPLLSPDTKTTPLPDYDGEVRHGHESEIAILFVDLRDFTNMAAKELPYDVVFMLNRYFAAIGEAIAEAGGRIDKFIGDGVMALFGVDEPLRDGCRRVINAARAMGQNLQSLNDALAKEGKQHLRIGIGAHVGQVIIGEMGYQRARTVTAIGDAVNIASRLESMTKELDCEGVFSSALLDAAEVDGKFSSVKRLSVTVRGQDQEIEICRIGKLIDLPSLELSAKRRRRMRDSASLQMAK